jgi:hypothetical protein
LIDGISQRLLNLAAPEQSFAYETAPAESLNAPRNSEPISAIAWISSG